MHAPGLYTRLTAATLSVALSLSLGACGPGNRTDDDIGTGTGPVACNGQCADTPTFLSVADVETVIAQAIVEAQAQNADATIAVVDRVGNVLGVFRMNSADQTITIDGGRSVTTGLDGITYIPDTLAAIAKAVTGAYLSSEGNAFSTRTASQIVQQNFNPGEADQPGGPLFGVQFSNLPCSDLNTRFIDDPGLGPQRSPLGLSADAGGFPLYKDGTPVGGIGVIADGVYGLDANAMDRDSDLDELIALAGSFGYAAPRDRRGDRITADGKTFRFSDVDFSDLGTTPGQAPAFASLNGSEGALVALATTYTAGAIIAGVPFGQPASGIRADNNTDYPGLDAFVLVDDVNANRYPPTAGTDGIDALTANEVQTLLQQALMVANSARAQIRRPLGSQARVSVSVVDTNGAILGVVRTRDAPIFGTDVSLQKARTAAFFSGSNAATDLASAPTAVYPARSPLGGPDIAFITLGDYATAVQTFLGLPGALTDGAYAFSDRAGGNLSRPYFPDGQIGSNNGPLSKAFADWSPFSTGLQLDLAINRVIQHVLFTQGVGIDSPQNCATLTRLANGIQIFPGSVPIYRGNTLVGAIGVSGDGMDQDDMISFLGLHNAAQTLGIANAPINMRADTLTTPQGIRLRYVQCPQAPFINSNEQNVCDGK